MQLIAKARIRAHINGRDIQLEAGEAFRGSEREAQRLQAMGLLDKPKPKKKGTNDER